MNEPFKILLVEDDPNLQMVLQDYLELMQYDVTSVSDGEAGLNQFRNNIFDVCILDIMLPKIDGFALATSIRQENKTLPIIFLTAKSLKEDRLKGFMHGCDDYITKPFSTEELNVRIKAILRRCSLKQEKLEEVQKNTYRIGKYHFVISEMLLISETEKQTLTRKETALLQLLCENMNQLMARDTAQKAIWGETDYFISRSMDVFITRLRKYLKDDPKVSINNVHGLGFMLRVEE